MTPTSFQDGALSLSNLFFSTVNFCFLYFEAILLDTYVLVKVLPDDYPFVIKYILLYFLH